MSDRPAGAYRANRDGTLTIDAGDEAMCDRHGLEKPASGGPETEAPRERQPGSYLVDHEGQSHMDEKDEAMQLRHGLTRKRPVVAAEPEAPAELEKSKKGKGGK